MYLFEAKLLIADLIHFTRKQPIHNIQPVDDDKTLATSYDEMMTGASGTRELFITERIQRWSAL